MALWKEWAPGVPLVEHSHGGRDEVSECLKVNACREGESQDTRVLAAADCGHRAGWRTKQLGGMVVQREAKMLEEESEALQFLQTEAAGTQSRTRTIQARGQVQPTEEVIIVGEPKDEDI